MERNNALITELNKNIDHYLEHEEYDRADKACKDLCRIQGLIPADRMPEDFLSQLKRKEHENMHLKKTTKHIPGIAAAAAAAVLLIGGTASAAVLYNNNVHFSIKGLSTTDDAPMEVTFISPDGETSKINLPETSGETIVSPISVETGTSFTSWLNKKIWEETDEIYDSDDAVNWTKRTQTTRITEYQYTDYFTAAKDAGFEKLFQANYNGDVFYRQYEHLDPESDTDYSISGEFTYGKGRFTIQQQKSPADTAAEGAAASEAGIMVITATGDTENEREYLSSSGISYKLTDDAETGKTRTTTLFTGKTSAAVLTFTGMTEEEIHAVLDNIQP